MPSKRERVLVDGKLMCGGAISCNGGAGKMQKSILAVDDSKSVRKLVEYTLRNGGYEATTAEDGQEALDIMARDRFDAVILDINMPRLDGFEFLRRLKADESWAQTPVIMLTTEGQDQDKDQALRLGATAYLVKPFKPTSLLALLREVLGD
jgi:two-component system chemotaxis response regulator CheY